MRSEADRVGLVGHLRSLNSVISVVEKTLEGFKQERTVVFMFSNSTLSALLRVDYRPQG